MTPATGSVVCEVVVADKTVASVTQSPDDRCWKSGLGGGREIPALAFDPRDPSMPPHVFVGDVDDGVAHVEVVIEVPCLSVSVHEVIAAVVTTWPGGTTGSAEGSADDPVPLTS